MPHDNRPLQKPTLFWALFGFDGRLSRQAFWLGFVFMSLLASLSLAPYADAAAETIVISPVTILVFGAVLWSEFALAAKRMHDRGWSGWLVLVLLIPFVNLAFTLLIGLLPGDPGPNRFGPAANRRGR